MSEKLNRRDVFLTGSRAYGIPTEHSDIDVVVLVDCNLAAQLRELDDSESIICRFGKLNLVLCLTERQFDIWRDVTNELKQIAPVEKAIAKKRFLDAGAHSYHDSEENEELTK